MAEIQHKEAGKYSELPLRIASAVVLAAFALFCTWMGGDTFRLLALALTLVIFFEFRGLVKQALPGSVALISLAFLILMFASYLLDRPLSGLIMLGVGFVTLAVWEWLMRRSIWGAVALIYSGLTFVALVEMREGAGGLFVILFVFACVWGADTFAYFFGKTLGGPKLAPAISPNKTWSGFMGGFIGAIAVSVGLEIAFGYTVAIGAILLAILLAFSSQLGDLFESWVKRRFGQKDSGRIIPGHGGLLDRIDGLVFAIIAAWLISLMIAGGWGDNGVLAQTLIGQFFTAR